MSWATDRRLDYIDWRLVTHGEVRREHLMTTFGISRGQASADIASFNAAHPDAMRYNISSKFYAPAEQPYLIRRDISCDERGRLVVAIG